MSFSLEIKQPAHNGAIDAYLYYEKKQAGPGERFLDKMEAILADVAKNPSHFAKRYKTFRQALLKPFPYIVIFEVEDNVYKIIHAQRNPKKIFRIH